MKRRFQAVALVLGLFAAPFGAAGGHDAAACCPERAATPCHGDVEDCLSRAAMTCCAAAPVFPARPGAFFEHPTFQAPAGPAFEAPAAQPVVISLARRTADLSARASPFQLSVVLRI